MARAPGGQNAPSVGGSPRSLSKNQRRILTILRRIAPAREQLLAAMEDISPTSELHALIAAAQSPDPRERNKVAVIERETEQLVNWMEELGARGLDEALRLGVIARGKGSPWQRLAEIGVITQASSERLREAKDTRDELAHAYPPQSWSALRDAVDVTLGELDDYVVRLRDWAIQNRILPPLVRGS